MTATVNGFSYGLVTPVAAYLTACLGAAVAVGCFRRARRTRGTRPHGWMALGALAVGCGSWIAHFVAMMGFTVAEGTVGYDALTAYASLGVCVLMTGIGIFIAGSRAGTRLPPGGRGRALVTGARGRALFTGGTLCGLGAASMHYLGMAGMQMDGRMEYNTLLVTASVLIAVLGATAALWAVSLCRGRLWDSGAVALLAGCLVGMHYTGMAAARLDLAAGAAANADGPPAALIAELMIGPFVLLLLAGAAVLFVPPPPAPVRGPQRRTVQVRPEPLPPGLLPGIPESRRVGAARARASQPR